MGTSPTKDNEDIGENSGKYDQLIQLIIRPPRFNYGIDDLGPPKFISYDKHFFRSDFTVKNNNNENLFVSVWEPELQDRQDALMDYIIYLHGNCGCRLGVLPYLSLFLSRNCCVCALDTRGAGLSDGQYVSLGLKEVDDVVAVMDHLKKERAANRFLLYGHSAGAVAAINTAAGCNDLAGIICDCPFADLGELCIELANIYVNKFFNLAIRGARYVLDNSIQKRAGFKLKDNKPVESAKQCQCPCLLLSADQDELIKKHHAEDIKKAYNGSCLHITMECGHNDDRSTEIYVEMASFIFDCFDKKTVFDTNLDQIQNTPWGDQLNMLYLRQMIFDPQLIKDQSRRGHHRHRNREMMEMRGMREMREMEGGMMPDHRNQINPQQMQDYLDHYTPPNRQIPDAEWDCPKCTLHNLMTASRCEACGHHYETH